MYYALIWEQERYKTGEPTGVKLEHIVFDYGGLDRFSYWIWMKVFSDFNFSNEILITCDTF